MRPLDLFILEGQTALVAGTRPLANPSTIPPPPYHDVQIAFSVSAVAVRDPADIGPLDARTRTVMQHELEKIWEQARKAVFFVTHAVMRTASTGALAAPLVLLQRPRP